MSRGRKGTRWGESGEFRKVPTTIFSVLRYDVSLKINSKQRKYYMSSIKQLAHF